ncbi:MAG: glutaredoxin domain-containing protein [Nanoarchaeota archaeon]|nr:glutaredoxin domain-containing protein [Nanoarchaeota archaeon]
MKKIIILIFAMMLLIIPMVSSTCIYYFYGDGCPHCSNVVPLLEDIKLNYPEVNLHKFETWSNEANAGIFHETLQKYGITRAGVPAVFVGEDYLMGDTPIIQGLKELINKNQDADCPLETTINPSTENTETLTSQSPTENLEGSSPLVFYILISAAIAVIIYLLITYKKE